MVHLRTVPDAWQARVLAARLGCEGIVTQLRGNVSGPYPFGEVSVLVEEEQAQLAADLLLADEVEAAFDWQWEDDGQGCELGSAAGDDLGTACEGGIDGAAEPGTVRAPDLQVRELGALPSLHGDLAEAVGPSQSRHKRHAPWQRALAAAAALVVAGAPLLAHFFN